MAREASVGDVRVGRRCRLGAVAAKRLIAGQRADDERAIFVAPGDDVAQMVGIGIVVGRASRDPRGDKLAGQVVEATAGDRAAGDRLLVLGEGGVDLDAIGLNRQEAVAVGVVEEGRRPR